MINVQETHLSITARVKRFNYNTAKYSYKFKKVLREYLLGIG